MDDIDNPDPIDNPNPEQYLIVDTPPQAVTSGNWPEGWQEVGTAPDGN